MGKYLALVKNFFSSAIIKQADIFGNILINIIQIWAVVLIWQTVYSPRLSFGGFTLTDTILYYVVILLITFATYTNTADYISQNIKMGTLSQWLLRPTSILLTELARSLGEQLYKLLILVPIYIIVFLTVYFLRIKTNISILGIVLGGFFMIVGFLLNCLFEYTLSILAFWMDEVWSIKHFKEVVTDLLGGKRAPLAFFPVIIQNINKFLPFQFIYFIPAEYMLGKHTVRNFVGDMSLLLLWLMFFIAVSKILYDQGIRKYGAFGN